eukprot:CAMPEP_0204591922 /NCGR_PEP_ID=MMETSP0661-20131031/50643_1 /ASSEMBLY_ACC=CAM_ASM_000606 /TAXON_ID=109239 /ORGANISM="Alexandrium margalefi, Strain AMGDE01CS-322" /LENGTH=177 /DNA_ID=CAMNT_0051602091 /DNA_START=39 /DNA_END=572 /DNA_ORIENTATION=-
MAAYFAAVSGGASEMKLLCQEDIEMRMASRSTCAPLSSAYLPCLSDCGDDEEEEGEDTTTGLPTPEEYDSPADTPRLPSSLSPDSSTSTFSWRAAVAAAQQAEGPSSPSEDSRTGTLRRIPRSYDFRELCDLDDEDEEDEDAASEVAGGHGALRRIPRSYNFEELCDLEAVGELAVK